MHQDVLHTRRRAIEAYERHTGFTRIDRSKFAEQGLITIIDGERACAEERAPPHMTTPSTAMTSQRSLNYPSRQRQKRLRPGKRGEPDECLTFDFPHSSRGSYPKSRRSEGPVMAKTKKCPHFSSRKAGDGGNWSASSLSARCARIPPARRTPTTRSRIRMTRSRSQVERAPCGYGRVRRDTHPGAHRTTCRSRQHIPRLRPAARVSLHAP